MTPKTLLITGADGNLGQHVVTKLLADGWILYANVLTHNSALKLQLSFPVEYDTRLFTIIGDLSHENDVNKLVKSPENIFGLIHLAGGYKGGNSVADYTIEDFDYMINLNTKPAFLLLKYIVPILKSNRSGAIVTIAAKPVLHPVKGNAVYTASKAALSALTLSAAEELREFDVRANCILPAVIKTSQNINSAGEKEAEKFTPPEQIADVITFLVSESGRGITGTLIPMYNKINA
jgi:NAD(P)-dependent dehydrogenase (short-subunit alcohol dehydrogenase family)